MSQRTVLQGCILLSALILMPACGGGGGAESPEKLLQSLAQGVENGDSGRVEDLVDQSTPTGELMAGALGKMAEVSQAVQKMKAAAEKKFGKEEAQKAMAGSSQMSPTGDTKEFLAKAKIEVDGDTATITNPERPNNQLKLVRKSGQWYIDAEAMAGGKTKGASADDIKKSAEMMEKMFDGMIDVFNDTSLVDQSKDADAFKQKLGEKMREMMISMMSKIQGAS